MPREYRLSVGNRLYLAGFSAVWFGACTAGAVAAARDDPTPGHVSGTIALVALALAPPLVTALLPYKATLDDYGELMLQSVLRTRRLRVAQIRAIDWDEEDIYLHYDGGKARLFADENFRDLLARVLVLNPAIEIDAASRELIGTPP
jgi:hypothetical protein